MQATGVWNIEDIKKHFQSKTECSRAGSEKYAFDQWNITTDKEVLKTISSMPVSMFSDLKQSNYFQYPTGEKETGFIDEEITSLKRSDYRNPS